MRAAFALSGLLAAGAAAAQEVNDYPTASRVEYAVACMAANGETPDALQRCSCAIDAIADVLPFDDYAAAETVLRMRQTTGERSGMFRGGGMMEMMVADLRRAEAEAEILCF
ncbi:MULTISPECIES: hypothetical protein [unclassified Paracoccus (in: a-proteobacteria)]|uniref:hypothetical protein n=1 Tax=unclassified Paracoccus (in: a-proteobacteria) TaxID=2688777 RepID=UPI001600490D|nr:MULTISPECIES: hypothetical protein [unclassified Paracoccus (in: a-proteobacteria)]MBB1491564.1 hypothetical protein [Paracoccus sp. MC1854]MBB1497551.1 hypothetical protein [Paracoccus sp. MC1862]QQO44000.1 hypothetical protein JGR78_11365 [Paracoccus sp. MC1862]